MYPYFLSGFQLHHLTRILTQITFDLIIIIDFPQEADTLTVFTFCINKMLTLSNLPHLVFHHLSDGEHCLLHLPIINLSQEIGLVFYWVWTCRKPCLSIDDSCRGIVPRSNIIIVMTHFFIKSAKLNQSIAHHI